MDPSTGKSLLPDRLRAAAEAINRESDNLTSHLKQVEQALKTLGLGIVVELREPVFSETDFIEQVGDVTWVEFLGYGKCVGKSNKDWGLYIRYDSDGGPDGATQGLADLPRDARIRMGTHLHKLLDLMATEAEKVLKNIQEANVSAQEAAKRVQR